MRNLLVVSIILCWFVIFESFQEAENRARQEKFMIINRMFQEMHVLTDINERLMIDLTMRDWSIEKISEFMHLAQQAARHDGSSCIDLTHLDRALQTINFGISITTGDASQIYKVAHHEAAHAVMSLVFDEGYDMTWVSLQPHHDTLGYVYYGRQSKQLTKDQRKNRINGALAGAIAEQVFGFPEKCEFDSYFDMLYDFFQRGSQGDFAHVEKQLEILAVAEFEQKKKVELIDLSKLDEQQQADQLRTIQNGILKTQYYQTIELVKALQPTITAVAQELLEKKVLSYKRVIDIIEETRISKK